MEKLELSPFQRYFNYFTFYLFTLSVKYQKLEDYDEEGPFENHYKKFFKIKTKLNQKIIDDDRLLINKIPFNNYFDELSNLVFNKQNNLADIKKMNKKFEYDKSEIQKLYFDFSDTLSKSKIRFVGIQLLKWSFPSFVFAFYFFVLNIGIAKNWIDIILASLLFIIPVLLICFGLKRIIVLKKNKNLKLKFKYFFSSDYCFRRIKESEKFFSDIYKIDNDYYDISELEIKFPEFGNFYARTVQNTELSDSNKKKLLNHNKNLYVRAVFSDFFELLKKEGIEQYQQIPFMFLATLNRAKLPVQGNSGFSKCINSLFKNEPFTAESFNQATTKYGNEEDLFEKYRNILKKYENILQ